MQLKCEEAPYPMLMGSMISGKVYQGFRDDTKVEEHRPKCLCVSVSEK